MSMKKHLFIIFSIVMGSSGDAAGGCSSSCGSQIIWHPFRLKGDPESCGVPEYELTCDDSNKTVLELTPGKYQVTSISYETATLQVVDLNLATGLCRAPFLFPPASYSNIIDDDFVISSKVNYRLKDDTRVFFINCSIDMTLKNTRYVYIPCLSAAPGKNASVYAFPISDSVKEHTSCRFISTVPVLVRDNEDHGVDVFQLLQKGFPVTWGYGHTRSRLIQYCLSSSLREVKVDMRDSEMLKWLVFTFPFGNRFLSCLHDNEDYAHIPFVIPLLLVVCCDIATILIGVAILVRFILAPLCCFVFLAMECRETMNPIDVIEKFLRRQQALMPTRYSYYDIIAMTRNFREKLGQGGFGTVYKGELLGGRLLAVKMLGNSKCNGEDFINEVSTIGRIHHLNVVRLVGFCSEGANRALIYEFMPNGSLDKYIFSPNGAPRCFPTEKLVDIALRVARAIDYLHRGCEMSILHFDIKPHNILLDHDFNPKVSDFGLAKLFPKDHSMMCVSAVRGTLGYIASELVSRSFGVVSHKSDVYSFGMLLLEMAGGRRNVDNKADNSSQVYYPSWIYDRLQEGEGPEICHSIEIDDLEKKLCKVGLWCIQMRPPDRPSMSRVIEMLEADDAHTLEMPPKPFSSSPATGDINASSSSSWPSSLELSVASEAE